MSPIVTKRAHVYVPTDFSEINTLLQRFWDENSGTIQSFNFSLHQTCHDLAGLSWRRIWCLNF